MALVVLNGLHILSQMVKSGKKFLIRWLHILMVEDLYWCCSLCIKFTGK